MFKAIKYFLLILLVVIIGGAWYVISHFEGLVKDAVHKYGSQVAGSEVTLGGISLHPFSGELSLKDLSVANPKGYSQPNIISLGDISVKLDVNSLTTDNIVIDEVKIDKYNVTYEMSSLTKNNISQLLENIKSNSSSSGNAQSQTPAKEETKSSSGKKVSIKEISITQGTAEAAAAIAGQSTSASVNLPDIIIEDLNNKSIIETITTVLTKILTTSYDTIVKSNLVDIKGMANDKLNEATGGAADKVKGFFGL